MKKAGYNIIREFYVNDAGAQMMNLAKSLKVPEFNIEAISGFNSLLFICLYNLN